MRCEFGLVIALMIIWGSLVWVAANVAMDHIGNIEGFKLIELWGK